MAMDKAARQLKTDPHSFASDQGRMKAFERQYEKVSLRFFLVQAALCALLISTSYVLAWLDTDSTNGGFGSIWRSVLSNQILWSLAAFTAAGIGTAFVIRSWMSAKLADLVLREAEDTAQHARKLARWAKGSSQQG